MKEFDFLPDEGVPSVLYLAEIPTLTPMYKCCCARYASGMITVCKLNVESQQDGGLLTRIPNNSLDVTACQIKGHN